MLARAHLALVGQGVEPTARDVRIAPVASVAGAVAVALGDGGELWRQVAKAGWFQVALPRLSNEGGYVGTVLAGLSSARAGLIPAGATGLLTVLQEVAFQQVYATSLPELAQRLIGSQRRDQLPAESTAWVDWTPPEGIVDRCALAAISWMPSSASESWETGLVRDLLEILAARARTRLHDIDAERFTAAYLLRRLIAGAVNSGELGAYDSAERAAYTPDRRPTWELHRMTPRLVEVVALGWATLGAPQRAEDILRERIEQAVRAGTDPDTVGDAQTALVRLFREYRVALSSWSLGDTQATGLAEVEQAVRLIGERAKGSRVPRDATPSARPDGPEAPVVTVGHIIPTLRRLEIEALDRPESTANELFELARNPAAGHEIRADMAYVLGVLACARAGLAVPKDLREHHMRSEAFSAPSPLRGKWGAGWTTRLQAARAYAAGEEQKALDIAAGFQSPELDLARRLTHVRLKPWRLHWRLLALIFYSVALYGVVLVVVLKATEQLPNWVSFLIGAGAVVPVSLAMRLWESLAGISETFARRVWFSVEYPGQGPVAQLKVSAGSRPYRLRRMSSRAALFYSVFPGRGRPSATVSLSAAADRGERFTPARWRVPPSTLLSSVIIAELDVPPALGTLPWERWLAATSRSRNNTFVWIRPSHGWPEAVPAKGPPLFAGPDHMANQKVVGFLPPVSGRPALASAAGDGSSRLVHVVGTPVQTSAGWRLRVEGGGSSREAADASASTRRKALVSPTDLVAESASVVVLQASPAAAGAGPFAADREGWFAFAADVLEAGAASVLTVPPLGDEQAEQAVDLTTDWVLRTPDDLQPVNVVRLLKDLTRLVASGSERGERPWAQDDVVGFVRLLDQRGGAPTAT